LTELKCESITRRAAGAPRWQIESCPREFERVIGRWKPGHKFSGAQRLNKRTQEWH
jgi:hypothetical protein